MRVSNNVSPLDLYGPRLNGTSQAATAPNAFNHAQWRSFWERLKRNQVLDGYTLTAFLASQCPEAQRARHVRSDQHLALWQAVAPHLVCARSAPLLVHVRTWPQIEAAQRAMRSEHFVDAIKHSSIGRHAMEAITTVKRRLTSLTKPAPFRSVNVDLLADRDASAPRHLLGASRPKANNATAIRSRAPSRPVPPAKAPVDDPTQFRDDLTRWAKEIRTPGRWDGCGGEMTVAAITHLPQWPKGRPLHVFDANNKRMATFGDPSGQGEPISVRHNTDHYDAIVDGRTVRVAPDGDCFFASVLTAMGKSGRKALLGAASDAGTGKSAQLRLRGLVADAVEQMGRRGEAPESVVNTWVAYRDEPGQVPPPHAARPEMTDAGTKAGVGR